MELPTAKSEPTTDFLASNSIIYGAPKIGKTTFASQINDGEGVLFACTEKGHNHVSIYGVPITTWKEFLLLGRKLKDTPDHGYKLLVVDIVDWLYKACEAHVCERMGIEHPSDADFGKGFSIVKNEFVRVINSFNALGLGICFISHATQRDFKADNLSYSRWDTTLSGSPSTVVSGMCDFIFYIFEKDGKRYIRTKGSKFFNSGDRTGKLPEILPLEWSALKEALDK